MTEEWRPIPGRPGYEASTLGRIRNAETGHIQNQKPYLRTGRVMATFGGRDRETRARVVLRTFAGPPPCEGAEASHLNGDRTDDRPANLAWESRAQNEARKVEHGTLVQGERVNTAKLNIQKVIDIYHRACGGEKDRALAAAYGVHPDTVALIRRGKTWKSVLVEIEGPSS